MGILGELPESGLRIDVQRPRDGGPPWEYTGEAATPAARFELRAIIERGGNVIVAVGAPIGVSAVGEHGSQIGGQSAAIAPPEGLEETAKLIFRAAYKHAQSNDPANAGANDAENTRAADDARREGAPPRRIQRWRADKGGQAGQPAKSTSS